MQLRPYQEEAADFLYERDRGMILASVGAGKTAITLTAMQAMINDGHVRRFLVLAPKRVCTDVWPVETKKWVPELFCRFADGSPRSRLEALDSDAHIVATNYDNIPWLAEQELDFDAIVFDELTKLKNPSGARFKALLKIIEQFKIRWGLTGSFTSNGLEDVFGQCKIVDQNLLGRSKGAFMQQYFVLMNKDFGEWAPRPNALPLVMAKIKPATFVLESKEYKDKLPPCHTVEMRCAMDMTKYNEMKKDFVAEFPDAKAVAANAGVVTGKLQQMSAGFVYETTRVASEVPGKFVTTQKPIWMSNHKFDLLEELLDENQRANTILVYQYQEEVAELKRRYKRLATLDDVDAIAKWNRGETELLAVHPKSAGHGLNLQTGGSRMVFLSLPWSLELYEQTVGRLHRSGQMHEVWVYILMAEKTVDEKIWAALHNKRAISEIAMEELKWK
jgi:SNF2 family DNA or RNA helicase